MYSSVTIEELKHLILTKNIKIIDLRDNYLYNLGSFPKAINVPLNFLLTMPDKYLNKIDTYYLACNHGIKSAKACMELTKKGYKVINIIGGYSNYK